MENSLEVLLIMQQVLKIIPSVDDQDSGDERKYGDLRQVG